MQTFAVTMPGSRFESTNKIRNILSLFTFTYRSIYNKYFAFLEDKGYKKKFDTAFDETSENGKLDKVIKEAPDENSNSFLTLAHGNLYSTAFAFSYLKKNYPLLLEMYNNYIKLDQCKDEYVPKKIKRHCKFILSTLHTKQKVDFVFFVAMYFLKELEL